MFMGSAALVGCGPPARTLTLCNWSDYLAPELAARFTAKAGATVVQDLYASEAELLGKLESGSGFDVCVPVGYQLSRLQQQGFLRAIEVARVGSIKNLSPMFAPWLARQERGGECFAVPYLWGTTGIGYDSEKMDAPTSWKALFEVEYAGKISVIDSMGDVFDQGLLAEGLGINSRDKAALQGRVLPRLREQKKLLRAYDSDPARALVTGDTWIAQTDSGDLLRAREQKPSLRYVIPVEGATLWVDYLAIPAAGRQPELSHAFLEFMCDPEIAALSANYLRFATPNQSALERGLIVDRDDPSVYPPPALQDRLFVSENWLGGTEELVEKLWLELRGD